jgi:hypothetical protein
MPATAYLVDVWAACGNGGFKPTRVSFNTTSSSRNGDELTNTSTYPNPVSSYFVINHRQVENVEKLKIQITNVAGAVMYEQRANTTKGENTVTVQTNQLQNGLYIVTIYNSTNKAIYNRQIVIQRNN